MRSFACGAWLIEHPGRPTAVTADPSQNAMRIDLLGSQLDAVSRRLEVAETHGKLSIQRVGVVRYNPFADTGSNQSFVLAMLDAAGDGFVLSSLHSRQQTRVFLKQVSNGKADTGLSEEESRRFAAPSRADSSGRDT